MIPASTHILMLFYLVLTEKVIISSLYLILYCSNINKMLCSIDWLCLYFLFFYWFENVREIRCETYKVKGILNLKSKKKVAETEKCTGENIKNRMTAKY